MNCNNLIGNGANKMAQFNLLSVDYTVLKFIHIKLKHKFCELIVLSKTVIFLHFLKKVMYKKKLFFPIFHVWLFNLHSGGGGLQLQNI